MADKGGFSHYMLKEIFEQPQSLYATIAREADGVIYTNAGPEISIASTKAFTSQMACLFLFALYLAQEREQLTPEQVRKHIRELLDLPAKMSKVLEKAGD